jgi:hypothetical protein
MSKVLSIVLLLAVTTTCLAGGFKKSKNSGTTGKVYTVADLKAISEALPVCVRVAGAYRPFTDAARIAVEYTGSKSCGNAGGKVDVALCKLTKKKFCSAIRLKKGNLSPKAQQWIVEAYSSVN